MPSAMGKTYQELTRREYADGWKDWLLAREDRNAYLLPLNCSESRLTRIDQFTFQFFHMLPDHARVVDLGFGPEGRDLADLLRLSRNPSHGKRLDLCGIELVPENVQSALANPEFMHEGINLMAYKLEEGDITERINLGSASVKGIILSSVIQHFAADVFYERVVPEIERVMAPGGIMQLIFKATSGAPHLVSVDDPTLGGKRREFYLYNAGDVVAVLESAGFNLYLGDKERFGGVVTWVDQRKPVEYAGIFMVKRDQLPELRTD